MWGFTADSAAQNLCRGYHAALGHLPSACLVDAGRPALGIAAIIAATAFVFFVMARSALSRG